MKVFLSHSASDKPIVRRVKRALENHGQNFWLDECELLPADSLREKIDSAIEESDCVIAFISKQSLKSTWVKVELRSFRERERAGPHPIVIPLVLDDAVLPKFLAQRIQVRMGGNSFGAVVDALLKAILRTHAVLRLCPSSEAFFDLEPFAEEIDRFRTQAAQGALHTVFDAYELADRLDAECRNENMEVGLASELRMLIPRSFDAMTMMAPRLIETVLTSLGNSAGAAVHAERAVRLVWRMVAMSWTRRLLVESKETAMGSKEPFDFTAAAREWEALTADETVFYPGFGIRVATWLKQQRLTLAECADFAFVGRRRADGTAVRTAFHIFVPRKLLPSDATHSPAADFTRWDWATTILPLIAANAVMELTHWAGPLADGMKKVGLAIDDYEHYR